MAHHLTLYQSRDAIDRAIKTLCDRLVADGRIKGYTALVLMDGAETFFNCLASRLESLHKLHFDRVVKAPLKSYKGARSTGKVEGLDALDIPSLGNRVIVFDDILDTGTTLNGVLEALRNNCSNSSPVEACSCMLFYKELGEERKQPCCDYYGIKIRDEFVVGYGLDYNGLYRELDGLYILSSDS